MFFIYVVIIGIAIAVVIQIIRLQVHSEEWEEKMKTVRNETKYTKRGDILSSDGYYLAASLPICSAYWDLQVVKRDTFLKYVDTLAGCMSSYFQDQPKEQYRQAFIDAQKNGKRYYKVKTNISVETLNAMSKFPIFCMSKNKSGFIKKTEYKRQIIDNLMIRRTIGTPDSDNNYTKGMEAAYNEYLKGNKYIQTEHKLSSGDFVPYNMWDDSLMEPGCDIVSTINLNIQDITEKSLLKQLQQYKAKCGTAVVMEVATGKIRAMINLSRDSVTGKYREDYIYAIGRCSEPGSTFKLASMIDILESGAYDINDTIDTGNGVLQIAPNINPISDDHKGGMGKLTVNDVFAHSSNIGFAIMVINAFDNSDFVYADPRLNNRKNPRSPNYFIDRLYNMNINKKCGIKLPGERSPFINYPGQPGWSKASLPQTAIGYELKVTPIQTLTLYNAVANNGVMVRPQMLESVMLYGETRHEFETEVINPSICSEATLKKVQKMLISVVENGTGQNIKSNKYLIAGKTGTAQVFEGKKKTDKHQASFAGYFPADRPKYSCIVVIYEPEGSIYGNRVAAPVFKEIADKIYTSDYDMQRKEFDLAKLDDTPTVPQTRIGSRVVLDRVLSALRVEVNDVEKSNTAWVRSEPGSNRKLNIHEYTPQHGTVPDVKGMGLRDALFLLRRLNIKVSVIGHGTVIRQSIAPDTQVSKNMKITIELG